MFADGTAGDLIRWPFFVPAARAAQPRCNGDALGVFQSSNVESLVRAPGPPGQKSYEKTFAPKQANQSNYLTPSGFGLKNEQANSAGC
jgi:hypothetical protein